MEPMTLGSPGGSPATNASPYLPSFLMGEPQTPTTPRNNTLSPNKAGRNLSFATSPGPTSPQDFNRSAMGQKTLFGYQQTQSGIGSYPATPLQSHNGSISGPPTQGLFDSLRTERNQVQTPMRATTNSQQQPSQFGTPASLQQSLTGQYHINQSFQQQSQQQQFTDSYIGTNSFNASRLTSPMGGSNMPSTPLDYRSGNAAVSMNNSQMLQCPPTPRYTEFWVTVYGFPPSASAMILQHFSQCGTIVDKVFPKQNGNWVHLKFSSRLECDKALNYNEKILSNNIMIGVTQCKDRNIIDKENICENNTQTSKVRPLAQTAYKSAQNDCAVVTSPSAPQKSSGLMNRAMDLFFGW